MFKTSIACRCRYCHITAWTITHLCSAVHSVTSRAHTGEWPVLAFFTHDPYGWYWYSRRSFFYSDKVEKLFHRCTCTVPVAALILWLPWLLLVGPGRISDLYIYGICGAINVTSVRLNRVFVFLRLKSAYTVNAATFYTCRRLRVGKKTFGDTRLLQGAPCAGIFWDASHKCYRSSAWQIMWGTFCFFCHFNAQVIQHVFSRQTTQPDVSLGCRVLAPLSSGKRFGLSCPCMVPCTWVAFSACCTSAVGTGALCFWKFLRLWSHTCLCSRCTAHQLLAIVLCVPEKSWVAFSVYWIPAVGTGTLRSWKSLVPYTWVVFSCIAHQLLTPVLCVPESLLVPCTVSGLRSQCVAHQLPALLLCIPQSLWLHVLGLRFQPVAHQLSALLLCVPVFGSMHLGVVSVCRTPAGGTSALHSWKSFLEFCVLALFELCSCLLIALRTGSCSWWN